VASAPEIRDVLLAVKDLIAVIVPFASIVMTHQFMAKREEDRYSKDFKQRRIDEFYGPMLSMTLELLGRRSVYQEIMAGLSEGESQADTAKVDRKERFSGQAETMLDESDRELLGDMQKLYREKLWMAEPSTVDLFQSFIAIAEISSLDSEEFASWKSLDRYARRTHLFEQLEADLRRNKEVLLQELSLA